MATQKFERMKFFDTGEPVPPMPVVNVVETRLTSDPAGLVLLLQTEPDPHTGEFTKAQWFLSSGRTRGLWSRLLLQIEEIEDEIFN